MTLEELRELEQAATEGPWTRNGGRPISSIFKKDSSHRICSYATPENVALIAAMRNALLALLDFVKAVEDEAHDIDCDMRQIQRQCSTLRNALASLE